MTTQTPKLLTEAEALELYLNLPRANYLAALRERGLIAEELVDPLLVEAREIAASLGNWSIYSPDNVRKGKHDDDCRVHIALAALRRGMELQCERLTVEAVDEALVSTFGDIWQAQAENVHAALTDALQ